MGIRIDKVVAVLPALLEPDAIYAVRVGDGFDLYMSDTTGTNAYALNHSTSLITQTGRFDIRPNRWNTNGHPQFGPNLEQWNTSTGTTQLAPTVDPLARGILLPAGRVVKRLHIDGYTNNSNVYDVRVHVYFNGAFIHRELMGYTIDSKVPLKTTFDIDYLTTTQAHLVVYVRSISAQNTRRFWYTSLTWEIV